jgi:predicted porin
MNIKPLIAASLALCAATQAHAQSESVQIYGRLNVGLEDVKTSADAKGNAVSTNRLSNNRSVLGFRGSEDLGGGLKAIFQIEGTLSPDTGAGSPAQRDTRVGLDGAAGTLFLGHWTTPYNNATAGLDPFYPTTAGYMSIMGNGSASTTDNVSDTSSFDRRQQNSLSYYTPVWNGFSLRTMQGLNEERPASGAKPSLTSLAGIYEMGPWYVVATHERHHEYQGKGLNDSGSKLAAAYRFGDTRVALIGEKLKYELPAGTLERKSWYVSATHQIGLHSLRLGVARAGDGTGSAPASAKVGFIRKGPDTGATHYTLGYDYNFSKRTSVFAYYTHLKNERNGVTDFAINSLTVSPGATLKGTVLGMRHNF